jgi:hypothetical protein
LEEHLLFQSLSRRSVETRRLGPTLSFDLDPGVASRTRRRMLAPFPQGGGAAIVVRAQEN